MSGEVNGVSVGPMPVATDLAGDDRRQRLEDGRECLEAALRYLSFGWSALAVCPPDHSGVGMKHGQSCHSPGKAPWGPWKEFQDRRPTETELRTKWEDNPTLNVGVALGPVSGLIRVDVDGPAGDQRLQEVSGGELPDTLEFTSGRENGGRGLLYAIPPGTTLKTTVDRHDRKEELRFQAKGSQTVLPPSRHPSTCRYAWKPGRGPEEIKAAVAPTWLIAQLTESAVAGGSCNGRLRQIGSRISEGGRNDSLTSLAGTMRRRGMSAQAIEAALLAENEQRCEPPLTDAEVRTIAKSISRYAPAEPGQVRSAYDIILDHFRRKYRPMFRRGTTIYSDAFHREVKQNEPCTAPGKVLLELLAAAVDAPRQENGSVKHGGLPRFFHNWAKSAWVDLLDGLPDEEQAEEIIASAQEEFGDHVAGALLTFQSFGDGSRDKERTHVERRSLIGWSELWAKEGRWQSVRSLCLWIRREKSSGLCVSLNARLFGQIGYRQLTGMTQERFAELAERYDVGKRLSRGQKAGGFRAVELLPTFLEELLSNPGNDFPGPVENPS